MNLNIEEPQLPKNFSENEINALGFMQSELSEPSEKNDLLAIKNLANKFWKVRKISAEYLISRGDTIIPLLNI